MFEYDSAIRLKKLFDCDRNLCRREATIAKNISKYNDGLSKLQAKIFQQLEELKLRQKEDMKLKKINKKLSKFLEEGQLRLQRDKIRLDELHQKTITRKPLLTQERQRMLQEMDNLRCFKSCTQTFINTRRVPELIQGVVVCEKETTSQLMSFKINPQQHTHQDVIEKLWRLTEESDVFNEHWYDLIIGCLDTMMPIQNISDKDEKTD